MKLHISDSSSIHHQEFIHGFVDSFRAGAYAPTQKLSTDLWINSWWWTEELSETCRVSCQNKWSTLCTFCYQNCVFMDCGYSL